MTMPATLTKLPTDDLTEPSNLDEWAELFTGICQDEWQSWAVCAQTDPEAFFPEKGGSNKEAKRICQTCAVRSPCLNYALTHNEQFGVWGGMSVRERRRLSKLSSAVLEVAAA